VPVSVNGICGAAIIRAPAHQALVFALPQAGTGLQTVESTLLPYVEAVWACGSEQREFCSTGSCRLSRERKSLLPVKHLYQVMPK
jgi:hypothetical protein